MLLKLYDLDHRFIGIISGCSDLKIDSDLSTGDKELSFSISSKSNLKIPLEYYIVAGEDEFVVKENSKDNSKRNIVSKLNLEELEGSPWRKFLIADSNALEAATHALSNTKWRCISTVPLERLRNISLTNVSTFSVLEKIKSAYTCEIKFDTINKIVYLSEKIGEDKGTCFINGFNLRELRTNSETYDFITRILPIGADGLTISEVNDGKDFLENYQYSTKIKTLIWEDSSYKDPATLKEDAGYKLNELSKPKRSFEANIIDLSRMSDIYVGFKFEVGDTVRIIDADEEVDEIQRIVKTTIYPDAPERSTCEISNTILTFEDLQRAIQEAAECLSNITTDNGTVKGSSVDKISVSQIIDLKEDWNTDVKEFKADYLYVRTEMGAPRATIGDLTADKATITDLNVPTKAIIEDADLKNAHVDTLTATHAKFDTFESDAFEAVKGIVEKLQATMITTDSIRTNYADIKLANIEVGDVAQLFAKSGLITSAVIEAGHVTGYLDSVLINADKIKAGTLSVDRLVINGTNESLIYALNNSGELTSTHCDSLDGGLITERTITADHLVAGTITANEIASSAITSEKIASRTITANKIATASITATEIAGKTITAAEIKSRTITATEIATKTITANNIAAGTITATEIATDAITANNIAAGTITAAEIATKTITANNIAAGAITATEIAAGAITSAKIAANAITADKIDVDSIFSKNIKATGTIAGAVLKFKEGTTTVGTIDGIKESYLNNRQGLAFTGKDLYINFNRYIDFTAGSTLSISAKETQIAGKVLFNDGFVIDSVYGMTSTGNATFLSATIAPGHSLFVTLPNLSKVSAVSTNNSNNYIYLGNSSYTTMLQGKTVYLKNTSTTVTSDRRLKNSFKNFSEQYERFFEELQPQLFKYNEGTSDRFHSGFVAQEVYDALEKAGLTAKEWSGYVDIEGTGTLGLIYDDFIALNTHMIQKAFKYIKELENRIWMLEQH